MGSRISRLTYAVGDVHGYDALFERLIDRIRADALATGERPLIVLLGDYVDRGPESREVLERVLRLECAPWCDVVALRGNHEDAMLRFLAEPLFGAVWRDWGGAATLTSYGVEMPFLSDAPHIWVDVRDAFRRRLDPAHLNLLRRLPPMHHVDDYLFVHAGVDPDLPLSAQGAETFTTIRGRFLRAEKSCDYTVVHGHTPEDDPADLRWRIGIDSGVYFSGTLTAVRLKGETRRFLQVRDEKAEFYANEGYPRSVRRTWD